MNNWEEPSKEVLNQMYSVQMKPMHQIAVELHISIGSVYNYLKKYGIPTRSKEDTFTMKGRKLSKDQCEAISRRNQGKTLPEGVRHKISEANFKGGIGHKKKRSDGYISVYFPDHPMSNADGYIMEHVLVMEAVIGRHLNDNEVVHHINHKRDDNRKNNLRLMTASEHMSMHMKERYEKRRNDLLTK